MLLNFSLETGSLNAEGFFYGWIRAGEIDVFFMWSGGNTMSVEEFVNGALDDSYTLTTVLGNGLFSFQEFFYMPVTTGDSVEVDVWGFGSDTKNLLNEEKTMIMSAYLQ